jgi:predicted nucleic acid-binding protein
VSEYINVLKRLKQLPKDTLLDLCIPVIENCRICPVDTSTLRKAQQLVRHYNFQIFDSIIVASAIEAGCETLYSEDMQHNLRVEDRLRIINPFIL